MGDNLLAERLGGNIKIELIRAHERPLEAPVAEAFA